MGQQNPLNILRRNITFPLMELIDEPTVGELTTKLGCLPLAIVQAGAYVAVRQISLTKYLEIYEKFFSNVFGEKPSNPTWTYGDRTVWTTWEISFQAIKEKNNDAAELLSLCSFFSNDDIGEDMLRRGKELEEDGTSRSLINLGRGIRT